MPDPGWRTVCQHSFRKDPDPTAFLYFPGVFPGYFQPCDRVLVGEAAMNSLLNTATGDILIERLLVRTTWWGRLRGLLFHRTPETGSAMLLVDTKRVHTHGMRFPLDLYYFDRVGNRNHIL